MYGAYGVVAALHERNVTGRGAVVRTSLLAAIVGVHAFQGTRYTVAGEVPTGQGNHHPSICPYGLFRCADGMVQIAVGSESLWRRLAAEFGLPAQEVGFATNAERVRNRDAVVAAVDRAFAEVGLEELLARLAAAGIPSGRVRTLDQVYGWDQTRSQGLLVDVEHASVGPVTLPGPPLRFDGRAGRTHQAPPTLGQHDASVRAWLDQVDPEVGPEVGPGTEPGTEPGVSAGG
jgi:crotonobetainyl-CoA:carnitine CoA-transferase CaiB-like acyl-CoA transferase